LEVFNCQKWVGAAKKTKLSNIFGWFWVCSQRYRSMITVVYFISGFIASFGTIFLRKVATFFYARSPLWLQRKILWKKKKTTLLGTTWGRSFLATTSLLWDKLPHDCLLRAMDGWRDGWMTGRMDGKHRCVCIWWYILQNYNYKLHFQNLSMYHIPHVFSIALLVTREIATYNPPGARHAFPKQWHMHRGRGWFIYFCQGPMDGWRDPHPQ
jgi:hypothetical protein